MNDDLRHQIIEKLRRGEQLSPEWQSLLFPNPRKECELTYDGKEREEDVLSDTLAVPLQPVRTFGKNGADWHNMLVFGDNLQVMRSLLDLKKAGKLLNSDGTAGIRLAYIDPPFATKQEFRGTKDQKAYQDKLAGAKFIEFLRKRCILIRQLLSDDGSLFVHLDQRKAHYIKVVLDEIFGEENFCNEIIWRSTNTHNTKTSIGQIHQIILYYRMGGNAVFNPLRRPHFKDHIEKNYRHRDKKGQYSHCDLTGPGIRTGDSGKAWKGYNPTASGRHWQPPSSLYDQLDEDISHLPMLKRLDTFFKKSMVYLPDGGGQPRGKLYLNPDGGNLVQDLWTYQPYTSGIYADSKECIDEDVQWLQNPEGSVEYPTQKPEGVIARIIKIATRPGDVVLDAFAGSGTTLAVAEKLHRRWVGVDCGKLAIYAIQKRMLNLSREIGNIGPRLEPRPFTLYNAGLYDFSKLKELPWEDWRFFALKLFGCKDDTHKIGGLKLDGKLKGASVLVFNHHENRGKRIDEETIRDIHAAVGKRIGSKFFVIAPRGVFDFQQDYFDLEGVRYYALRIPYSVINELHQREFTALAQPSDETAVNDIVDSWGFDFIQPPVIGYDTGLRRTKNGSEAYLRLKKFESKARLRGKEVHGGLESFSMLMLDFDYDGNVFELDQFYFAHEMEESGWESAFPSKEIGNQVMAVFIDLHGNEARQVIPAGKFGIKAEARKRRDKVKA